MLNSSSLSFFIKRTLVRSHSTLRHFSALSQAPVSGPFCICLPLHYTNDKQQNGRVHMSPKTHCYQTKRYKWSETIAPYVSLECTPIKIAHDVIVSFHDFTGLPWWASIAATTFLLRVALTLPGAIYSVKIAQRIEKARLEHKDYGIDLKNEIRREMKILGWTEKQAQKEFSEKMFKKREELIVRYNCHPGKRFVIMGVVQIPIWISLTLALRNMSGFMPFIGTEQPVLYPDLGSGGTLWFTNLLLPDSTWLLPLMLGASSLAITEVGGETNRFIKYFLRILSVTIVPIAASAPSCMSFYWFCSCFYGLSQILLLKTSSVRRVFGLPAELDAHTIKQMKKQKPELRYYKAPSNMPKDKQDRS